MCSDSEVFPDHGMVMGLDQYNLSANRISSRSFLVIQSSLLHDDSQISLLNLK